MKKNHSHKKPLSKLLKTKKFPEFSGKDPEALIKELQLKMLRIQQGVWHSKRRAIIVFEGFDPAGKGGAIRRVTETLDPRGLHVHPIGPPSSQEQQKHYLFRFWRRLPEPGSIAIFDRSWYGRVLVERVEEFASEKRWKDAYSEINEFEATLARDGIDIVKIFLAIHPDEQLRRFEARLTDPYKQWKLTPDDIEAHRQWKSYVKAADDLLYLTNSKSAPWCIIPADSKDFARAEVLKHITTALSHHGKWMEDAVQKKHVRELKADLKTLKKEQKRWAR